MTPRTPTEPGWYPDPWGTDGERRYDGTAWGRETRPGPGAPAPTAPPGSGPATADGEATPTSPSAPVGDLPPAAWYPDPAGSGGLRYWDGAAWTAHTAYTGTPVPGAPPGVAGRPDLDAAQLFASERSLARTLRGMLLVAGPALALQVATGAVTMHRLAPSFQRLVEDPSARIEFDQPSAWISLLSNISLLVMVATGLLFIVWLGTAGKVALARGRQLRRGPWLGAWSFAIPIVALWWPFRAAKDLFAEGDPGRPIVVRWWTLWIAGVIGQFVATYSALFDLADALVVAATVATAVIVIAGALAARRVVAAVEREHAELVGAPVQA